MLKKFLKYSTYLNIKKEERHDQFHIFILNVFLHDDALRGMHIHFSYDISISKQILKNKKKQEKIIMKKATALLISLLLVSLSLFVGCTKEADSSTLKVGATPDPHAAILEVVKDDLEKEGVNLEIVEFTDYVTPNEALSSGEIDANYFQHLPYLESANSEHGFDLVSAAGIHIEPLAVYSDKYADLDALPEGATIAIPNDPTNEGRALLLLESAGLITLKENAGLEAVPSDIESNPKNLEFVEIEAPSIPRVLVDVDAAVINGNYAIPAGLIATRDGLFVEGADSPYVNVIAVRSGFENDPRITALVEALKSDEVKAFIQERYPNGEVILVNE